MRRGVHYCQCLGPLYCLEHIPIIFIYCIIHLFSTKNMLGTVVGIAVLLGLTKLERIKLLKNVCVYVCIALPLTPSLRERRHQNIK